MTLLCNDIDYRNGIDYRHPDAATKQQAAWSLASFFSCIPQARGVRV